MRVLEKILSYIPKVKEIVLCDRGRSWDQNQREEDISPQFWAKEDIKQRLDGTVRHVVVHEETVKVLTLGWICQIHNIDTE